MHTSGISRVSMSGFHPSTVSSPVSDVHFPFHIYPSALEEIPNTEKTKYKKVSQPPQTGHLVIRSVEQLDIIVPQMVINKVGTGTVST